MNKAQWLKAWGYVEGTAAAEAAWAEKCAFRPRRSRMVIGGNAVDYAYDCPVTGRHITSKHQHEENLRLHGCHVLETGEKEANERIRAEADSVFEDKIDISVEKAIDAMPSDKREKLYNEMVVSDISVDRL